MEQAVERPKSLEQLLVDIDQMDPTLFAITTPIRPNETVIGELTPYLRKLYCAWQFWSREHGRLSVDAKYTNDQATIIAIHRAADTSNSIQNLFWYLVQTEYQTFGKHVGLRVPGLVVTYTCEHNNPLDGLIRQIFGGS